MMNTKEAPETLKIKLPNGTIFNMSVFSQGNTKEYLAHVIAVLRLFSQKGLGVQCTKLPKAVDKLAGTLKTLQKVAGSKTTYLFKNDVEAHQLEIEQTQQMLQEAQKAHNKAITKTYELLRNLLSGDAQTQWDCICRKMHKRDLCAGVNGNITKGRHPHTWAAFRDCFELQKFTVFTADVTKRQRFYIQQAVRKSQRATVRQHILQMGVLND
jgi:hypothetical protein